MSFNIIPLTIDFYFFFCFGKIPNNLAFKVHTLSTYLLLFLLSSFKKGATFVLPLPTRCYNTSLDYKAILKNVLYYKAILRNVLLPIYAYKCKSIPQKQKLSNN